MALSPDIKWYHFWIANIKSFFCPCAGTNYLINKYETVPMKIVND